jgi:hypothetical protein
MVIMSKNLMIKVSFFILIFFILTNESISSNKTPESITTTLPEYLYHSYEGFGYGNCYYDKIGIVIKQKKQKTILYDYETEKKSLLRQFYTYDSILTITLSKKYNEDVGISIYSDSVFKLKLEYKNVKYSIKYKIDECYNVEWEGADYDKLFVIESIEKTKEEKSSLVSNNLNYELNDILPIPFVNKGSSLKVSMDSIRSFIFSSETYVGENSKNNLQYDFNNVKRLPSIQPPTIEQYLRFFKRIENEKGVSNYFLDTVKYFYYDDDPYGINDQCYEVGYTNKVVYSNKQDRCNITVPFMMFNKSNDTILFPKKKDNKDIRIDRFHFGEHVYEFYNNKLVCINYRNPSMGLSITKSSVEYSNKMKSLLTKLLGKPKEYTGWITNDEVVEYHYDYGKCKVVLVGRRKGLYKHQRKDPFRIHTISLIDKEQEEIVFKDYKILGYSKVRLLWDWCLVK